MLFLNAFLREDENLVSAYNFKSIILLLCYVSINTFNEKKNVNSFLEVFTFFQKRTIYEFSCHYLSSY